MAEADPEVGLGGLTAGEVAARRAAGETNEKPPTTSRTVGDILKANVLTRFNFLLGSLFVVMLVVGSVKDALFGVVVVANAAIGVVQELRAKRTLDQLVVLSAPRAEVRRDGATVEVPAEEIVRGDVVGLRPGDQVVADGEVLIANGAEIDESLLTGESAPVAARPGGTVRSGSVVVAGSGWFRADAVGADAFASRLAIQAKTFQPAVSELQLSIDRVLKAVTWALVPLAVLLAASQLLAVEAVRAAVSGTVAGVVGMVPEGLVLLTSMAFALSVLHLGRRQVLVQELPAVEGLARVDIVCFDKTGTLTQGSIAVASIDLIGGTDEVEVRSALAGLTGQQHPNPTASAIADHLQGATAPQLRDEVGFSSARKWAGATFDSPGGTWILGGPDVLFPDGHSDLPATVTVAASGRRVVALARTEHALSGNDLPAGLRPQAVVVLEEQIRPDAAATIEYLAGQGVAVKVISGDDPVTVAAIARRVGIAVPDSGAVDARSFPADAAALGDDVETGVVFGRTTPEQKRAMVLALQAKGRTVAMTGDGVNDILALKAADVGIAMGNGAPASRAVAQVVLLDGRFASLPEILAEGRRVIGNVERVANLFLTKTCYVLFIALATGVARLPFPFLPRHLTLVSGLTIGIPGFFLAFSPTEDRYRPGFLRRVLAFAGPAGAVAAAASFGAYAVALTEQDVDVRQARTSATLVLLALGSWIVVLLARPLTTWRTALLGLLATLTAAILALPAGRRFYDLRFASIPVLLGELGVVIAAMALLEVSWRIVGRRHGIRQIRPPSETRAQR